MISTGARRLSIFAGLIGAPVGFVFGMDFRYETINDRIFAAFLATCVFFAVPFLLIRGIAWVIDGFRNPDRNHPPGKSSDSN